jgi:hypothetical protein
MLVVYRYTNGDFIPAYGIKMSFKVNSYTSSKANSYTSSKANSYSSVFINIRHVETPLLLLGVNIKISKASNNKRRFF